MKKAGYVFVFIALELLFSGCSLVRTLVYFQPKLETYKAFPEVTIQAPEQAFHFAEAGDLNRMGKTMQINNRKLNSKVVYLEDLLDKGPTASFIVIRNDTILYEYYKNEMPKEGVVTTFSVAKSFVATLLGIAIEEGKIAGINEPITTFFPELGKKSPALKSVTLAHLLKMKSGMKQANPIALYYGSNLKQHMKKSRYKLKPDSVFAYDNANTQLLGMAIERATGKPLYQYMEEKIWKPMGAEYDITWSVDNKRDKQVKAFCCLNGRTRDFAKFGRLYLNKGNWNGKQLVPENWVRLTAMQDSGSYSVSRYKMHWWLGNRDVGSFYANGMYNQYIWVYPRKNIVICRFSDINRETDGYWQDIFNEIVDQL